VSNSLDLNEFPDFREVAAKRRELRAEAAALEAKAAELQERLYRASEATDDSQLNVEAGRLLNGGGKDALDAAGADLVTELNKTRRKQQITQKARQMHEPAYEAVRGERAAELAQRLQPRHRAAVAKIAKCLVALERANAEEEAVRFELQQAGISNEMLVPASSFPNIGRSINPNSPISRWFTWTHDKGFAVDVGGED
jgi:hypothetical protein